ncbi:hypothetical protein [Actinoplanes aureus]|uniref:Uncharacterized protein n=1 Tax=Actinoplanes aureus TaxID=2792083 RepID=A0A931CLA4_9ACTN|nr:hypothetical protein [Actinoplanes aureus]MBG0569106.1 hypothetical protein [Actinoplanes aureus]MBG0569139.1 hypothetical protein [Actinoplanes aureus]
MFSECVTINLADVDMAEHLSEDAAFRGNGYYIDVEGNTITITKDCLTEVFGELTEDEDGHYDGVHLWIGGLNYSIRPASPESRPTGGLR